LPDIDKINLVSVDSIEKLNSILKANIASINGMVVVSGVGEPAAAYSMRLLGEEVGISSYTGPAVRVRRTGDDVEADVAFDSGEITLSSAISNTTASETTFGDFVGHGGTPVDAFVDTWYDQSSNANHAEQATPSSQPQIYDATNGLITENGKPALDVNNHSLETTTNISLPTDLTMFYVTRKDDTTSAGTILGSGNSLYAEGFADRGLPQFSNDVGSYFLISNTLGNNFSMTLAAQQKLIFSNRRGTTGVSALNGGTELTATASQTTGVTFNRIIGSASGYHSYDGLVQEAIFYAKRLLPYRQLPFPNFWVFRYVYRCCSSVLSEEAR